MDQRQKDQLTRLINSGSDIAGSVSGSLISAWIAGMPGAFAGGIAGPMVTQLFKTVGLQIKQKLLGDREAKRIGGAYIFALAKIHQKLDAGEILRNDGYFDFEENKRPISEEILEGILLLAQKEHEELKLKHFGYLVANISFDNKIDRGYANYLLKLAEILSYRQLCLLQVFSNTTKYELYKIYEPKEDDLELFKTLYKSRPSTYYPSYTPNFASIQRPLKERRTDLYLEYKELNQLELIDKEFGIRRSGLIESFAHIGLTTIGFTLRNLMELNEINSIHIEEIASVLRFTESGSVSRIAIVVCQIYAVTPSNQGS